MGSVWWQSLVYVLDFGDHVGKHPPPGTWPLIRRCQRPHVLLPPGFGGWLRLPTRLGCNLITGIECVQYLLIVQKLQKALPGGWGEVKTTAAVSWMPYSLSSQPSPARVPPTLKFAVPGQERIRILVWSGPVNAEESFSEGRPGAERLVTHVPVEPPFL